MEKISCPHCYTEIKGVAHTYIKSAIDIGKGAKCPYCNLVFYKSKPLSSCEIERNRENTSEDLSGD